VTAFPFRLRAASGGALCVSETGRFFLGSPDFAERLAAGGLDAPDLGFLARHGFAIEEGDPLGASAHAYGVSERLTRAGPLDYLILVPTLRCNLSCTYCQVSRAPVDKPGFDWSEATLAAVLGLIEAIPGTNLKIEFQGGEPTLRPDLISAVIDRCGRFKRREFVICTNLQRLDDEILGIFDRPDVFISTSLDGDAATHAANRTREKGATTEFLGNLGAIVERYGSGKLSALPTIDPERPPDIDGLIDAYAGLGLDSIFLRPINYQGFARKRHARSREQGDGWRLYYERFVRRIIARNWEDRSRILEETYLSICLRRIFQPGRDRHVDLRNPNPMGVDYIVVDHDGTVYPTDEARMLSRSGVIDLSIGDVHEGWQSERRAQLNAHSTNEDDPACRRCAYQAFCGRDLVDDVARYGRIDVPRTDTAFCRRHLHLFDFIFDLLYEDDPAVLYSFARWLRLPGTPSELGVRHL
jgi:His-Xaa-Ser system radical SAM maturase HxsB